MINASSLLDEAVLQLRKNVPLELVVNMFQKLVRILYSHLVLHDALLTFMAEPETHPLLSRRQAHRHGDQDGHRMVVDRTGTSRGRARRETILAY